MERGFLRGRLPFARFGHGPRPLVMLPGINDALHDLHARAPLVAWFYRHLGERWTVFVIGRRRGLAPGTTTRDMAADYARTLGQALGSADVVGLSMGAFIAQHLAADTPGLVRRLVLALAPHRPAPTTVLVLRRWIELAEAERWRALHRDMARHAYTPPTAGIAQAAVGLLHTARIVGRPPNPRDFLVSARACLEHDASARLAAIRAATLVVGGTQDALFPAPLFREAAGMISGARVLLLEGGHAVMQERKQAFDAAVTEFLSGAEVGQAA